MAQPMVSFWPPESGLTVYPDKEYWSQDKWDPLTYGQDFDPSRPFLAQLLELFKKVPKDGNHCYQYGEQRIFWECRRP